MFSHVCQGHKMVCVVSLITKQDTWLNKKLSVFPLQVISSAHGHLLIASSISLFPKPKPQMKPKIKAGTTQKAKKGTTWHSLSTPMTLFWGQSPRQIFDTNMLTPPWTPTREASLNHVPLGTHGCFQSISFQAFLIISLDATLSLSTYIVFD